MSKPIEVGDLVMVVRGELCCNTMTPMIGHIFKVAKIVQHLGRCGHCKSPPGITTNALASHHRYGFPIYRLKVIPPLAEAEETETTQEITA